MTSQEPSPESGAERKLESGDEGREVSRHQRVETRLVHGGRSDPRVVAPPVFHASTILFSSYAEYIEREADPNNRKHMYYGRKGTPTTRSLEDAIAALDQACGAVLSPSGTASVTDILSAFLQPGDDLLMVDTAYGPTRKFCDKVLSPRGIQVRYYDPLVGVELAQQFRDNTRMVFLESPGSGTMEVQDVPAIAGAARQRGILTAIDNTWATPLLFNPLEHGVDLSMQSGTKYLNGHADCLYGVTTSRNPEVLKRLAHYTQATGSHLAPDDASLALRGLRTLAVRLERHEQSGLAIAHWLKAHPGVRRVLHPALEDCPGHKLFLRDFQGACGLFSVVVHMPEERQLERFINALTLFGVGFSWGGFESLCLPFNAVRTASTFPLERGERMLRLHIGLENVDDLKNDLEQAFIAAFEQ
ncbi:MAG: cystathionine beta-lyase [Pseudomonadota bacterium]